MKDQEFLNLLEAHRHQFFRFVQRNLWKPDEAEDVFSSAVLTAYEKRDQFELGTNFRAWMYRILINKCYSSNRQRKHASLEVDQVDAVLSAEEEKIYENVLLEPDWFVEQCGDEVIAALSRLSMAERTCFLLLSLEKYSYKEIAQTIEIPVGTVITHLARGRAKLRKSLMKYAQEEGVLSRKETPLSH